LSKIEAVLRERLAPLIKYPNFRKLFAAQSVSLVGSWMQELAKSWIVLNMLGTASSMGALLFAAAVPNLLFAGKGGVLADSQGPRKTLIITQVLLATLAFSLGLLVFTGHVTFWHLVVFAVLEGTLIAFDIPAFNQVTPQIVPREDFQQALALNSVSFHLSRVLGPSIAGVVMGLAGPQSVFWLNALSFAGIVFVIASLPLRRAEPKAAAARSGGMGEVWSYLRTHPVLSYVLAQLVLVMTLVFPLVFTSLRVYLQQRFHLDARDYGLVFAMPGIGALFGSLIFLFWSPKNPIVALRFGLPGLVAFLFAVAFSPTLPLAVASMTFYSLSMFLTLSALLVTVQLKVEDHMRGRVSALVGMAFASLAPIMAVPMGFLSDVIGAQRLLWCAGLVFGAASSLLLFRRGVLRRRAEAA
jgi:predicted MFS family arabinose efflux permease